MIDTSWIKKSSNLDRLVATILRDNCITGFSPRQLAPYIAPTATLAYILSSLPAISKMEKLKIGVLGQTPLTSFDQGRWFNLLGYILGGEVEIDLFHIPRSVQASTEEFTVVEKVLGDKGKKPLQLLDLDSICGCDLIWWPHPSHINGHGEAIDFLAKAHDLSIPVIASTWSDMDMEIESAILSSSGFDMSPWDGYKTSKGLGRNPFALIADRLKLEAWGVTIATIIPATQSTALTHEQAKLLSLALIHSSREDLEVRPRPGARAKGLSSSRRTYVHVIDDLLVDEEFGYIYQLTDTKDQLRSIGRLDLHLRQILDRRKVMSQRDWLVWMSKIKTMVGYSKISSESDRSKFVESFMELRETIPEAALFLIRRNALTPDERLRMLDVHKQNTYILYLQANELLNVDTKAGCDILLIVGRLGLASAITDAVARLASAPIPLPIDAQASLIEEAANGGCHLAAFYLGKRFGDMKQWEDAIKWLDFASEAGMQEATKALTLVLESKRAVRLTVSETRLLKKLTKKPTLH